MKEGPGKSGPSFQTLVLTLFDGEGVEHPKRYVGSVLVCAGRHEAHQRAFASSKVCHGPTGRSWHKRLNATYRCERRRSGWWGALGAGGVVKIFLTVSAGALSLMA